MTANSEVSARLALRRGIVSSADILVCKCDHPSILKVADSKVDQTDAVVLEDEDVLGLDVPVHNGRIGFLACANRRNDLLKQIQAQQYIAMKSIRLREDDTG